MDCLFQLTKGSRMMSLREFLKKVGYDPSLPHQCWQLYSFILNLHRGFDVFRRMTYFECLLLSINLKKLQNHRIHTFEGL